MSELEVNEKPTHFIRQIIESDLEDNNKNITQLVTRFPPEPNGFLHIGHAKSICLNFGLAEDFQGQCNLRFDDTNPEKESQVFIEAIKQDVRWLGFQWAGEIKYASDYFAPLYAFACDLIRQGKAYVCDLSPEKMREYRGTLTEPGTDSPYRDRSIDENLELFEQMKAGKFAEGERVLRAKIDMASPNINLRDPILYRIRFVEHHQTGNEWCIYPMYDYTHCVSDALEGITHSLCTLEFEDHRPLYDWVLDQIDVSQHTQNTGHPQQIEFARLNLNYTITSKRQLKQLIDEQVVSDWDDPRMLTISGMRRRGYTPASLRQFCQDIGVSKADSMVDMGMLEHAIRQDLDQHAPRAMCVLNPIKVVITNYPEDKTEWLTLSKHPKAEMGHRKVPFERELWIDADDFMLEPEKKYFRLAPQKEVRLRGAYVIRCDKVIQDEATGEILSLECHYDPDTLGKKPEGRKVKGVIHWLAAKHAQPCQVRLYDRLFTVENPAAQANRLNTSFLDYVNPNSCQVLENALIEPSVVKEVKAAKESKEAQAAQEQEVELEVELKYQFERLGYFCLDIHDSTSDSTGERMVFNRTVTLKDTWAKLSESK